MINLNNSVMIYRPIKQVFDFISAAENDFQWQYGILESARLSTLSYGEERPMVPNSNEKNRSLNRRDDFVLVK